MAKPVVGNKVIDNNSGCPPREVIKVEEDFVHISSSDGGFRSHVNQKTFDKNYTVLND